MNEIRNVGDWLKVADLGSGAFGVVSLWRNGKTNESVAIKSCKFQTKNALNKRQRERWIAEIENIKSFVHPNVIKYKQLSPELFEALERVNVTKLPLLSMEYCDKGNLRNVLCNIENCCGLPEIDVRHVLCDICSAVQYLHSKNVTHRDIKPENIVVHTDKSRKSGAIYKLIDLGYAKDINDTVVSFVGTLEYLAPEICQRLQYNYCVDYWSLGIVVFEIICGILPFLPGKSLPERFYHLKKKGPEDIRIYETYNSGRIEYSKEIFNLNNISSCFKIEIEKWLRRALQFDPEKRSEKFSQGTLFEYMNCILKKKIINVFYMNNLELYSYEIDHSTLIGTIKRWIERDTKVDMTDFVVLFSKSVKPLPDDLFVVDYLTDNNNVYVIKKSSYFHKTPYTFPYYIRKLFVDNIKFNSKEIKQVYRHGVYYLSTESKINVFIKKSINLFIKYVKNLVLIAQNKFSLVQTKFKNVTNLIDKINSNLNVNNNIRLTEEQKDCFKNYKKLLEDAEKCLSEIQTIKTNLEKCRVASVNLADQYPSIDCILRNCDIDTIHQEFIKMVRKDNNNNNPGEIQENITKKINQAIRMKDRLFINKELAEHFKTQQTVLQGLEILIKKMFDVDAILDELVKDLGVTELHITNYMKIIMENYKKEIENKKSALPIRINTPTSPIQNPQLDSTVLIKRNDEMRENLDALVNQIFCFNFLMEKFDCETDNE